MNHFVDFIQRSYLFLLLDAGRTFFTLGWACALNFNLLQTYNLAMQHVADEYASFQKSTKLIRVPLIISVCSKAEYIFSENYFKIILLIQFSRLFSSFWFCFQISVLFFACVLFARGSVSIFLDSQNVFFSPPKIVYPIH